MYISKRQQVLKINDRLVVRGKIRLPKVEHPKFEGQMTPNKYQTSV